MQISITGHNIEVSQALRDYTEEKVAKVRKYLDTTINAHVILKVEKLSHIAEVTIHANGVDLHGEDSKDNMYASIDSVMDKIDRQAKKFKGKRQDRRKGGITPADTISNEED